MDDQVAGERIGIGRTAEVFAWGPDRVVKVLRPAIPEVLGTMEADTATLAAAAVEAAPRFFGTTRVEGRLGLVYERLDGPSMLDLLSGRPWQVGSLARRFAGLHAAMHGADGAGLPDLGASLERMIERGADHLGGAARAASLERLRDLPGGRAVCHGDMHPGNVIVTATGPVVIDWMTATAGPPAADVARTLFLLRDTVIPPEYPAVHRALVARFRRRFASSYLAEYRRLAPLDDREVARWRLPMLAARLGEQIEAERPPLLDLLARELAAPA